MFDLVIKGGEVFTPSGLRRCDLGITGERIAAIDNIDEGQAAEVFDAAGLTVLPGIIDTQVHFREPGLEHKEDLESGSRAAAMGGVTSFFEMPNTSPSTLSAEDLADKLARAEGRAWCDHAFFMGAARENLDDLPILERLPGCAGVKVFMGSSTGSLLVETDEDLRAVLTNGTRRVAIHSEDEARLRDRFALVRGGADPGKHPLWRDVETALTATRRLLALARAAGRRVHVLHVTTAEELPLLADNKDIATVEVTPQHLTLAAPECYERFGTLAQMNPPIREARHREALWRAVSEGLVDVVGSDHAPHTREEKAGDYPATPSGMPMPRLTTPFTGNSKAQRRAISLRAVSGIGGISPDGGRMRLVNAWLKAVA